MNWLIVEDEADIRNLVAMMCQVWGNVPMTYESGQKAWDWLDSVEAGTYTGDLPDFALMDIRMPGKRGNEISARIRTLPSLEHIPIVLMTAFVMSEEEMNKMKSEFGVDDVINKPLPDFDRLRTILYTIIEKKQKENASKAAKPQASEPAQPAAKAEQPDPKPPASPGADVTRPSRPPTDTTDDDKDKPDQTG